MPQGEPIRLKFIRSTIDPRSILVDEQRNPVSFDELYDWAKRKLNFVVIDADTGGDITRILLAQN
jgi:polyhydroxyalkanoate synthesis regulator protein